MQNHTHCKRRTFGLIATAKYKLNQFRDIYYDKCPTTKISLRAFQLSVEIDKLLDELRNELITTNVSE